MIISLILATFDLNLIHLGLAGAALSVISGLLIKSRKDVKDLQKTMLDEIKSRDEFIVNMQKQTIEAITENTTVLKQVIESHKE